MKTGCRNAVQSNCGSRVAEQRNEEEDRVIGVMMVRKVLEEWTFKLVQEEGPLSNYQSGREALA